MITETIPSVEGEQVLKLSNELSISKWLRLGLIIMSEYFQWSTGGDRSDRGRAH